GVEGRVIRLPVTSTPPPEGKRPKSEEQFRFYEELKGEPADRRAEKPLAADARPAVAPETPPRSATVAAPAPKAVETKPAPAVAPPPAVKPAPAAEPPHAEPPRVHPAPPPPPVVARVPVPAPAAPAPAAAS